MKGPHVPGPLGWDRSVRTVGLEVSTGLVTDPPGSSSNFAPGFQWDLESQPSPRVVSSPKRGILSCTSFPFLLEIMGREGKWE